MFTQPTRCNRPWHIPPRPTIAGPDFNILGIVLLNAAYNFLAFVNETYCRAYRELLSKLCRNQAFSTSHLVVLFGIPAHIDYFTAPIESMSRVTYNEVAQFVQHGLVNLLTRFVDALFLNCFEEDPGGQFDLNPRCTNISSVPNDAPCGCGHALAPFEVKLRKIVCLSSTLHCKIFGFLHSLRVCHWDLLSWPIKLQPRALGLILGYWRVRSVLHPIISCHINQWLGFGNIGQNIVHVIL